MLNPDRNLIKKSLWVYGETIDMYYELLTDPLTGNNGSGLVILKTVPQTKKYKLRKKQHTYCYIKTNLRFAPLSKMK